MNGINYFGELNTRLTTLKLYQFHSQWKTYITFILLISFQEYMFYKQMCVDSKQYDPEDPDLPLYRCDFSNGQLASEAGLRMQ